jgi:hypothetical protein
MSSVTIAAIYLPCQALFGSDLLDLTVQAKARGINLSGADLRKAWANEDGWGGFWLEGGCENKHYNAAGKLDN